MHKTLSKCLTAILLFGGLILTACGARQTPTTDPQAVLTEAAATVAVQLTQAAALTPSPAPSNTPEPTTAMPESTATVDEQPAPPTEPAATSTTAPPPQAPDQPTADSAGFVADVSIPDNTAVEPGASFRKTWRIKNTGTTTWTTNYALVYIDGERMDAPDRVSMPNEVKPGEEVELSVDLTAPTETGTHKAFFRLRNANGQFFHLDGSGDLWVQIVVGSGATAEPTAESTATPEPEQ